MSVVVPHRAIEAVSLAANPKQAILSAVSNLDAVEIFGDIVLLGTYIRPEKTAGGIIRPTENVVEDVWQGKVGLVLKLGTSAFMDTPDYSFQGQSVQPGDWVVYNIGDTRTLNVNGYPCRYVRDFHIKMRVKDPSVVL